MYVYVCMFAYTHPHPHISQCVYVAKHIFTGFRFSVFTVSISCVVLKNNYIFEVFCECLDS